MTNTVFADWQIETGRQVAERERRQAQLAEAESLCGQLIADRTSSSLKEACKRLLSTSMEGRPRDSRPNLKLERPVVVTFNSREAEDVARRHPKVEAFAFPAGSTLVRTAESGGRRFVLRYDSYRTTIEAGRRVKQHSGYRVEFDARRDGTYVLVCTFGYTEPSGRSARPHTNLGYGPDSSE